MRIAVVFSVLTWLVLSSVSIAQNNYAEQSRVMGGGVARSKAEAWASDKKLHKGSLSKAQLNQIPEGGSQLVLPAVNGFAETSHHRFEVIELVDDKTTLLLLDKERYILSDCNNRKLEVGEKVRLVPSVQLLESKDFRGFLVPVLKLATAKECADYRKKMQGDSKKKR